MNIYTEARAIALEALTEAEFDRDAATACMEELIEEHEAA